MEKSIRIAQILGDKQEYYLGHSCKTIDKSLLYTPGPDVIEKVWMNSDRNLPTLNNMRRLLMQGRLANTGYVSILPVDQGVEHTAGASFAPNPLYFDPENIVKLAIEGGCNAVVSTFGVLGSVTPKRMSRMPTANRKVNVSEKTKMPIMTAVTGSRAPMMAEGVEPILLMEMFMKNSESTVGNRASWVAHPHCFGP